MPELGISIPGVGCLIQSLIDLPDEESWLSPHERLILAGMRFSKRRDDWRLGRWTAKRAIQASSPTSKSLHLSTIEIRAASDGAPEAYLKGRPASLSISLSHSHGLGLCVVGPEDIPVGCDLEFVEPRSLIFIEDYFTAEERDSVKDLDMDRRALFATVIWSAKESVLKVLRAGLRRDTRDVVVYYRTTEAEDWNPWTGTCANSGHGFYGWWRNWRGYIQTVAADRSIAPPHEFVFGVADG